MSSQPPIIPGPPDRPMTLAAMMPPPSGPAKRGVHPLSIVLAVVGGVALVCGGLMAIGSFASRGTGAAAASPSPYPVYVYDTPTGATGTASTNPPPPPPPGPPMISGGGVLLVPSEVPPGTWRTTVPAGERCYWARLRGTSGAFGDIITNGNAAPGERVTVTVMASDKAFESAPGCGTWAKIG